MTDNQDPKPINLFGLTLEGVWKAYNIYKFLAEKSAASFDDAVRGLLAANSESGDVSPIQREAAIRLVAGFIGLATNQETATLCYNFALKQIDAMPAAEEGARDAVINAEKRLRCLHALVQGAQANRRLAEASVMRWEACMYQLLALESEDGAMKRLLHYTCSQIYLDKGNVDPLRDAAADFLLKNFGQSAGSEGPAMSFDQPFVGGRKAAFAAFEKLPNPPAGTARRKPGPGDDSNNLG